MLKFLKKIKYIFLIIPLFFVFIFLNSCDAFDSVKEIKVYSYAPTLEIQINEFNYEDYQVEVIYTSGNY